MHNIVISTASREVMRVSIYSLIRLKAAMRLSFLTLDQPTIEVITYWTLEKLLSLCAKNIISPMEYHKHIYGLLMKLRNASLPYSAARSLILLILSYSSKVMVAQDSNACENIVLSSYPGNKSISKTLSCTIGETGAKEVGRILDMFYINA